MQTGLRFLFVVTILLHLVNFVEKTRTEWTNSSYGKRSQLLPWVAGKQPLSFHPTRCLAAEDAWSICRALGMQEGARISPQHPAHPAPCLGVGQGLGCFAAVLTRVLLLLMGFWEACMPFFFFFNFLPCSALQWGWIKRKPNKKSLEYILI